MPLPPVLVTVTAAERKALKKRIRGTRTAWRGRFADRGLEGLSDLPRPGRPRQISAEVRAAVVALACQLPAARMVYSSLG